ncbi:MAG: hypothetical protein K6T27_09400 [Thermoleophilum sp.]|nr:hypothetical protein [Thermoleophilum sp.]
MIRWGEFVEESPKTILQGLFEVSSTKKHPLGTIRKLSDGRVFAYAKAGSVSLSAGRLCQAPVQIANHLNIAVAAAVAVDSREVTVTLGATAVTANQYEDGFLYINSANGGFSYKIKSHPSASASANLKVTLYDKVRKALTTSDRATLLANPFGEVIVHPSPPTAVLVGVPQMDIAAGSFFWILVRGLTPCLIDGTPAIGDGVVPSDTVDGAVEAATTADVRQRVGTVVNTGVNAEFKVIQLALSGF